MLLLQLFIQEIEDMQRDGGDINENEFSNFINGFKIIANNNNNS